MSAPLIARNENLAPEYLSGGGELGQLIREYDWASTPLGGFTEWPQSLRTCIRIMLTSRQPIWIGWGRELIKFYNDPYKAIVGGKHPWALGKPASVVWKDIWKDIEPMLKQVMEQNEGTYAESQLLIMERNGYPEETYYTFSYTPIPGDNGGTEGMICANSDDTGKIISERQLKTLQDLSNFESKNKTLQDVYKAAAASLAKNNKDFPFVIIYQVQNKGNEARQVAWAGIEEDHPLFPAIIDLHDPGERNADLYRSFKTRQMLVAENGPADEVPKGAWEIAPAHFVYLPIANAGGEYPHAILVAALNPYRRFDETFRQFTRLISDQIAIEVNDVLAYEEEWRRAEALAEIDRAKTTFFSNISHEFRTPLTLLLGPIEDLMHDPHTIEANKVSLEIAHRNSLRLLKLVNSLLDFSRIEARRMKAHFERVEIAGLTRDLAASFRSVIEKGGLEYIVDCKPLPGLVAVDVDMWENIVLNLISNAYKYTNNGSITVQLIQGGGGIEFSVSDTGIGIPRGELSKIFERFHRVENIQGRTQEGTGIGLSLVKELVNLLNGDIHVQSAPGKGSVFTVFIPKIDVPEEGPVVTPDNYHIHKRSAFIEEAGKWRGEKPAATPFAGTPSSEVEKPRVLVVDDNADMRDYIYRLLQERFHVMLTINGEEAYQALTKDKYDLVLSDVMMPKLDGFGLLEKVRAISQMKHLPFIFLSARAGEEARVEGLESGADDYLVKPFSGRELLVKVEANIRIARTRQASERNLEKLVAERTAALQRSNEDLQQFAHVASHDLKEPVRKLRTFGNRLQEEFGAMLPEKANQYIAKMEGAANRMAAMIDGVLLYSSLEAVEQREEKMDLNEVIRQITTDLEVLIADKNGVIEYKGLPVIKGSDVLIYQLFYNLISNSLKFSRQGIPPLIRIECRDLNGDDRKPEGWDPAERWWRISVKDNGIGFRQNNAERIFKTFSRLNAKDKFEGTGLGLALCKKIVERHHGFIRAEGNEGEGADFIILWPYRS